MPNTIYISSQEPDLSKIHFQSAGRIPSLAVFKADGYKRCGANKILCLSNGSVMWCQKHAGPQTSEHGVLPVLEDKKKSCLFF